MEWMLEKTQWPMELDGGVKVLVSDNPERAFFLPSSFLFFSHLFELDQSVRCGMTC